MINSKLVNNKKQEKTMETFSNEMKRLFEKLIELFITTKSLEDLFSKLKDDLFKNFDEKISAQNTEIENLESIISNHENNID